MLDFLFNKKKKECKNRCCKDFNLDEILTMICELSLSTIDHVENKRFYSALATLDKICILHETIEKTNNNSIKEKANDILEDNKFNKAVNKIQKFLKNEIK